VSPNLPIRRVLWLIGLAFVLHEAEEWNLVTWFQANFEPPPQFTDRQARTLLVLFATLGISFTALSIRLLSLRVALFALLPLFVAIVLGNALTHIFWLFYFETYAPGVLTSALLLVPLTLYLIRRVLQERLVPPAYVWLLLALALLQPLGAAAAGSTLSGPHLAFQRLGARLAGWLWSGV
jgi:hypothetical protein